jgi:hypothetical protein
MTVLVSQGRQSAEAFSPLSGSLVQEAAPHARFRPFDISELQSPDGGMHHDRLFALAVRYPRLQQPPAEQRQRYGMFLLDAADARPVEVSRHAAAD